MSRYTQLSKEKVVQIKYDKNSVRMLKVVAIAATVLLVIGFIFMYFEISGTEVLTLSSLYIGVGLVVYSYFSLFSACLYMRRLRRYGYEIPERKSDYDGKVENLHKIHSVDETSIYSTHSKWCAKACLFLFAFALFKQSSRDKYRDDVEIDTTRTERWGLEQVLFTMVVLCLLSIFANYTAHSMADYFFTL